MKNKPPREKKSNTEPAWYRLDQLSALILIILYSLVDYIPNFGGADVMGAQWVYLSGLNIITALYLISLGREHTKRQLRPIIGSLLSWTLLAFLIVAGLSIFWALNQIESMVVYARLLTTAGMFFLLSYLLAGRPHLLKPLSIFFTALLLFQSLEVVQQFLREINEGTPFETVIFNIKGNTGNKNILAASLAIKFPFLVYAVWSSPRWAKLPLSSLIIVFIVAIAMVNARSSFVSVAAQLFLMIVFTSIAMIRNKKWQPGVYEIGWVLIPVIIGFLLSNWILQSAMDPLNTQTTYNTIAERSKTITFETSGRNNLWLSAIDYIQKHPIYGCGYGNWKLASIPYEKEHIDELLVAYHAHNDFLETTAETGWLGGVIYILLFGLAGFWLVKILISRRHASIFNLALIITMSLASYFTDAMFNFPAERPIMQFFLALTLAAILQLYQEYRSTSSPTDTQSVSTTVSWLCGIALVVSIFFSGFFNFKVYQSLLAQFRINKDISLAEPKLDFEKVNQDLPSIPNLNAFCFPVKLIKARYLMKAQRYPEAIQLLEECREESAQLSLNEFLTARCYLAENKKDSALFFATKAFEYRPRVKQNYLLENYLLTERKDSLQITKNFNTLSKLRKEPWVWINYLNSMSTVGVNERKLRATLDSAIILFPDDPELREIQAKPYAEIAKNLFNSKNYEKAMENYVQAKLLNPDNYVFDENIGICYYVMNEFREAIPYFDKVIISGRSKDAKSWFLKGSCHLKLGQKAEGCLNLQIAASKNYPGASELIKLNCNN